MKGVSQHINIGTEFGGFLDSKKEKSMQGRFSHCFQLFEAKPLAHSRVAQPVQPSDSPKVCKHSGSVRLGHENRRNLKLKIQLSGYSEPSWTDRAGTHEQATA